MVKKVFISVGMSGRKDHEIAFDIDRAYRTVWEMFEHNVGIYDNWGCIGPTDAGRLWYLGEAIKKLGACDACYFVKGWQNYKGCVIEHKICELYGIEIIEES